MFLRHILLAVLLFLASSSNALAFFTSLEYGSEEQGRREVLSFHVPPGFETPRLTLIRPTVLRVTIPGLLALPFEDFNPDRTRFIRGFKMEEIPGAQMGLHLTIALKEPYLNFRGHLVKNDRPAHLKTKNQSRLYRLEIERYPEPSAQGPTMLLEGRAMAGRDATLVVISYTGNGWVDGLDQRMDKKGKDAPQPGMGAVVDFGARVVRLTWPGASLDPGWRPVKPAGLAEKITPKGMAAHLLAYAFPDGRVEMELGIHSQVQEVYFYRSPEAGTFIVELRGKNSIGRQEEAENIIEYRKRSLQAGHPLPLNRLTPVFIMNEEPISLSGQEVDEGFFWANAKKAEQDRRYRKARAILDSLLEVFPYTINREVVELYKIDLARQMDVNTGWMLDELTAGLARYPNNYRYTDFRLFQLQLLNEAHRYEDASAILTDPNLPKDNPQVALERAKTALGLADVLDPEQQFKKVVTHLKEVSELDERDGLPSAEASYLWAEMEIRRACGPQSSAPTITWGRWKHPCDLEEAVKILNNMPENHLALLSNSPKRQLDLADIYYKQGDYQNALRHYIRFLDYYNTHDELAPWAILRAAESERYLGETDRAKNLLERLFLEFPESDAAIWARVFRVQLQTDEPTEERLKVLDEIIKDESLSEALIEANLTAAQLLGDDGFYHKAMDRLNELLLINSRPATVERTNQFKHKYMVAGMKDALAVDSPEKAISIAERFGEDWRSWEGYGDARVTLAEALMRLGMYSASIPALEGLEERPAEAMLKLANSLEENRRIGGRLALETNLKTSAAEARIRLDEARRLTVKEDWINVINLLDELPTEKMSPAQNAIRLRLLAQAEAKRGRFPQAVSSMEMLLYNRDVEEGKDYYDYAVLMHQWKGDDKALPIFQEIAEKATDKEIQTLANIRIGDILQRKGDLVGAEDHFRAASEITPNSPWANASAENAEHMKLVQDMIQ
ncbi:MAG: tetratricopeptide repeat protein [Magnetococcales bacterium]|nr:tetratricopeptide repeat protein [Magnetococcales bacterium]